MFERQQSDQQKAREVMKDGGRAGRPRYLGEHLGGSAG